MIDNHVVTQGALYEGAFYTIPFLQCIALSGTGLGEKESVDLLTEIAIGVAGFDSMVRFSVVTEPFVYFIPDENGLAMPLPIACRWGVSMKLPDMIPGLIHHDVETRDRYFDLVDSYSEYAGGIRKIMDGLIDNLRDDMLKRRLYKLYNNLHRR
ncbi:hypothetical protein [Symmachiella dynata]|uniref:hypothetical protein n=1 Tax=Symmachiella dynata TaxID=2527995 RepID=UPI0011A4859E|nr:hypothetical protein [Symmachiella dynata]